MGGMRLVLKERGGREEIVEESESFSIWLGVLEGSVAKKSMVHPSEGEMLICGV